jgi:thiol-disulfide isomerase/thioredoxin
MADIEALRVGTMKKLTFTAPEAVSEVAFTDPAGDEHRLSDWQGRWVLVNFWATWCAPCREEMPGLDALERDFGGERFAVVPIATGRNALPGIERFFAETGVTALPVLLDPKQALARDSGVLGLPVTLIVNPEGQIVARMLGDADWAGESARAIVAALLAGG